MYLDSLPETTRGYVTRVSPVDRPIHMPSLVAVVRDRQPDYYERVIYLYVEYRQTCCICTNELLIYNLAATRDLFPGLLKLGFRRHLIPITTCYKLY